MDTPGAAHVSLGWLWLADDRKADLEATIAQAAARFQEKFGQPPRLCYVNGRTLRNPQTTCGRVTVLGATNVLPGCFLFVVEGQPAPRA